MEVSLLCIVLSVLVLVYKFLCWFCRPLLDANQQRITSPQEATFFTSPTSPRQNFPSLLNKKSSLTISVIVPAYNESIRIDIMLHDAMNYLNTRHKKDPYDKNQFNFRIYNIYDTYQ